MNSVDIIAQACHASTAALWLYKDHPNTIAYAGDLDNMHKVVLEAKDENALRKVWLYKASNS